MKNSGMIRFSIAGLLVLSAAGAGVNLTRAQRIATSDALAEKDPPLRIVLNVPAHRLYVFENGEHTKTFKVSVGLPGHQTPAGEYKLSQAIWNPWWHPPASPWAEGRKPEPPGPTNPMGRVKLNFAPLLYIHGTTDRVALGDPASHGCVRMMNEDLLEFTRLVQSYTTPGVAADVLDRLAANPSETREFNFKRSVPFEVVYNVAAVTNGFLYVYPDVYRKVDAPEYETQVRDVLADNGIEYDDVDHRLKQLLKQGQRTRVAISLDTLRAIAASGSATAGSR